MRVVNFFLWQSDESFMNSQKKLKQNKNKKNNQIMNVNLRWFELDSPAVSETIFPVRNQLYCKESPDNRWWRFGTERCVRLKKEKMRRMRRKNKRRGRSRGEEEGEGMEEKE